MSTYLPPPVPPRLPPSLRCFVSPCAQLQTEIKIHRTLQHPRVVRFEMFFEDRENVYILLELCTNYVSRTLPRFACLLASERASERVFARKATQGRRCQDSDYCCVYLNIEIALTGDHIKHQVGPTVHTTTYIYFAIFYQQYLVLLTMPPRNTVVRVSCGAPAKTSQYDI